MNWVMEKAKTIHTFQNRIIMPLRSKTKTKTWREEKDYTSRNQGRVKNSTDNRHIDTELYKSHVCFLPMDNIFAVFSNLMSEQDKKG